MPSLIVRDGKSMRYQYAGRLRENDLVYLFIAPSYSRLLDRLFASRAAVDPEDAEFFGAFAISPLRPAADLDAAYGPGLLAEHEKHMTIAELMRHRLGGKADYADRVRLGSLILIVRDLDENDHIQSVGMSLEAVDAATRLPIFMNIHDIVDRFRDRYAKRRKHRRDASSTASDAGKNDA
jgi:cell volume regulation protein A